MTKRRQLLGAAGEEAVAAWYSRQGYRVLDRNWRCAAGEIDLVAGKGRVIVFCEVKTRSSTAFGVPAEAVTATKQARLRRLAARWLAQHRGSGYRDVRFDVASVLAGEVEILEAAF
jgi:putative endonuclease